MLVLFWLIVALFFDNGGDFLGSKMALDLQRSSTTRTYVCPRPNLGSRGTARVKNKPKTLRERAFFASQNERAKKDVQRPPKIDLLTILPLFELHFGSIGHSGGAPWPTLDSKSALLGRPWGHLGPKTPQSPPKTPESPPKTPPRAFWG